MFNQFGQGDMDSDLLNFMLEIERRCKFQDFSYFGNMNLDYGREGLGILTSVIVLYFISKFLCSSGLLRKIRGYCLSLRPQIIPASATTSLVSLAQFI
jgi:hypothetical protein